MKPLSFRPVLFATTLTLVLLSAGHSPAWGDVNRNAISIPSEATWIRHMIQASNADATPGAKTEANLQLETEGVVSVYLNGRRLVRNHPLDGPVVWEVGSLLRPGVNCLAIAAAESKTPGRHLGAFLNSSSQPKTGRAVVHREWKISQDTPPVGWQQTDFNDRDWKKLTVLSADKTTLSSDSPQQLTWEATDAQPSRMIDGQFRFRDHDHVVLLGATFFERAQQFGHLESAICTTASDQHLTFRNLAWSADTVFADSRGIFDAPKKGYERMVEHVRAEEPTVIFVCYGQNEAMEMGEAAEAMARFQTQLKNIHRDLRTTGAEIVFVTPHPFVSLTAPLPDAAKWNPGLQKYRDAVLAVAHELNAAYVDLFTDVIPQMQTVQSLESTGANLPYDPETHPELSHAHHRSWTDNGMHWNNAGYRLISAVMAARLSGAPIRRQQITIDLENSNVATDTGEIRNITWKPADQSIVTFDYRPHSVTALPIAVEFTDDLPEDVSIQAQHSSKTPISFAAADRLVSPDEQPNLLVAQATPDFDKLRDLIVQKNQQYFYRWRPQNITYLFGFRKHEQGNNASEIAQFDPFIDKLEQQIHQTKQPQWHTISINVTP